MTRLRATLHIGLHKTATTWMQQYYFPKLSSTEIDYNPPATIELATNIFRYGCDENDINALEAHLRDLNSKSLFLSAEIFSGDLFRGYPDFESHVKVLKRCFKEWDVHIIFVLREPISWTLSCYKESFFEHHYQQLIEFTGISGNIKPEVVHMDLARLSFSSMIDVLDDYFGDNTHILFFEDFRDNQPEFLKQLCKILGVTSPQITNGKISNRGYTPAVMNELHAITCKMETLGLGFLVPQPVFFFGERSIYLYERRKYKSLYGKVIKKLTYPFRRGNWLRLLARQRSKAVKSAGQFDPDQVGIVAVGLEAEINRLRCNLEQRGITDIPPVYEQG